MYMLELALYRALKEAQAHLDYIGWGDSYEREGTEKLRKEIDALLLRAEIASAWVGNTGKGWAVYRPHHQPPKGWAVLIEGNHYFWSTVTATYFPSRVDALVVLNDLKAKRITIRETI